MESPVYENHYAALTRAVEEINLLLNKLYELFARRFLVASTMLALLKLIDRAYFFHPQEFSIPKFRLIDAMRVMLKF